MRVKKQNKMPPFHNHQSFQRPSVQPAEKPRLVHVKFMGFSAQFLALSGKGML